jgi:hypothetical protein
MTDDDSAPENGSPTDCTDLSDDELLAERLEVLANRVSADLHGLAASVRDGEDVDDDRVDDARHNLLEADRTVRRHLGDILERDFSEVERDPRKRQIPNFTDLYDVDYLANDAPREEVAHKLAADVLGTREAADRVDRALYAEDLSDVDVEDLWDYALRLRGWSARVLSLRTDRDVVFTREEAEALEKAEEKLEEGA